MDGGDRGVCDALRNIVSDFQPVVRRRSSYLRHTALLRRDVVESGLMYARYKANDPTMTIRRKFNAALSITPNMPVLSLSLTHPIVLN